MLRQHSALVWTCFGKYAMYLSPVLVPIHHESSLGFPDLFFYSLPTREHFCFEPGMGRALFCEIQTQTDLITSFCSDSKKEHLADPASGSTSLLSNSLFPSRWGSQGISTPFSTAEERATFSMWTLKKEPRVRQELSASGPVSRSGNASFFPPS